MARRERGITLLEILITLAIMGILAALAIPNYFYSSTRTYQKEATQVLKQIYVMQRAYFVEHECYYIPPDGTVVNRDNPQGFKTLYVDIIATGRYTYTIEENDGGFLARAVASDLDEDPTIDEWTIDHRGMMIAVSDDALK